MGHSQSQLAFSQELKIINVTAKVNTYSPTVSSPFSFNSSLVLSHQYALEAHNTTAPALFSIFLQQYTYTFYVHSMQSVCKHPYTSSQRARLLECISSNLLLSQWTIYSATTFLEKCRKVVLEKWFCKLGFFFLVNHFSRTRKNVDLWYKTTFFSGQPLFSNQIS